MNEIFLKSVLFLLLIGVAFGCDKVPVNTGDSTPPGIEIKIRGTDGQYAPASSTPFKAKNGSLDIMCIVSDPDGVKSVTLDFLGQSKTCTLGSGAVYSGSFPIGGLPSELKQTLTPDASGKVLTKLPLMATLKGPLTCTVLGNPETGTPYGAQISVTCSGSNWSSNAAAASAAKTLEVKLE